MPQSNGDEQFHMWDYWYEKKGLDQALEEYYPHTLKNDPAIAQAYQQMKNAERAIQHRMEELNKDNADESDD